MDYGMKIIDKKTNQECDYVSLDSILDNNILKNSFEEVDNEIYNNMSTSEDWQKYLISKEFYDDKKLEEIDDYRFIMSLHEEVIVDFPIITNLITKLFGSMFGIDEVQVFWDKSKDKNELPVPSVAAHTDEDNFIWIKLNENRTLTILGRDETNLNGYSTQNGDKFSYFSPLGFFHDAPERGCGIAMRISLNNIWFSSENKSEKCKEIINYIKSFSYKSFLTTGNNQDRRLSFVDYSECISHDGLQARFDTWNGFMFYNHKTDETIVLKEVNK